VSQVSTYPATSRTEKRLIRVPARPVLRLPRVPFWMGTLIFAIVGSFVMVLFPR
jgi:hypothetical protein